MKSFFPCLAVVLALAACQPSERGVAPEDDGENILVELGARVPPGENREYSYTDKQDAYYYGRTHAQVNDDWFSGWNVRTRRLFRDYSLLLDGKPLGRAQAIVTVYPHLLRRQYDDATEELALFDFQRALSVRLEPTAGQTMAIALIGEAIQFEKHQDAAIH